MVGSGLSRSKVKQERLRTCTTPQGLFTVVAVDHRAPLRNAIATARGPDGRATAEDMAAFKSAVTRILGPHASAVLLDPEYSLPILPQRPPQTGLILAYERTGYDTAVPGRLPELLPAWSVRRLAEAGAAGLKLLLYYNPRDEPAVNEVKHAFVERVGAECQALEVLFFLEPVTYHEGLEPVEFARRKPAYVLAAVQEFSRDRYGVDVLKVQLPVDPPYVAGTRANTGQPTLFSRAEALDHLRAVSNAAQRPLIFLSGGATDEVFLEGLALAGEADARFAGVACGRATWQDAVAVYAQQGVASLEAWLADEGVRRVLAINDALATHAMPWWK
ncbi:MAG: tagatose 1,6-diphosphate aldolase [Caldilineales bacterium]|nr:tagatose 1,6-diphosphate aldolase [Caldilineales bacterium]